MTGTVLWYRQDLRTSDHEALVAACARGPVTPVFVWHPEGEGGWPLGAASRWWLDRSLRALEADLVRRGSRLVVRIGDPAVELAEVARAVGASTVACSRRYEPAAMVEEERIQSALEAAALRFERRGSNLLFDPFEVRSQTGTAYKVFSPFWRACMARTAPESPLPAPERIPAPASWPAGVTVDALALRPHIAWDGGLADAWTPGEAGGRARLERFIAGPVRSYGDLRDIPSVEGTSSLSPHLHFGEVGPRQAWHASRAALAGASAAQAAQVEKFRAELGWREFGAHVLANFPRTSDDPLRPEFRRFPWRTDAAQLRAWERGRTGYPFVDAGMRQLWHTGWMHNRVRMVVASFLVKHLLMDWMHGARWFWDTLVDADLASNTLGWQWAGGCGADAAPYFRIFNPVTQGEKFDPEGTYVRRWVPELARVPTECLHAPWDASPLALASAGVTLGEEYPRPIVDHVRAREDALAALAAISAKPGRPDPADG
jgi:deoxyribodipyrimidine photo-lyase